MKKETVTVWNVPLSSAKKLASILSQDISTHVEVGLFEKAYELTRALESLLSEICDAEGKENE